MTTNGSELLNNVFRSSCKLPVAAIIEDTFYKCVSWFEQRRVKTEHEAMQNQLFSYHFHKLINKRFERSNSLKTLGRFGNFNEFEVTAIEEKVHAYMNDGFSPVCQCQFQIQGRHQG